MCRGGCLQCTPSGARQDFRPDFVVVWIFLAVPADNFGQSTGKVHYGHGGTSANNISIITVALSVSFLEERTPVLIFGAQKWTIFLAVSRYEIIENDIVGPAVLIEADAECADFAPLFLVVDEEEGVLGEAVTEHGQGRT